MNISEIKTKEDWYKYCYQFENFALPCSHCDVSKKVFGNDYCNTDNEDFTVQKIIQYNRKEILKKLLT